MKKQKKSPQPRNFLVKLALFRRAGSHRKSNKALRRAEKVKKLYPIIYNLYCFVYYTIQFRAFSSVGQSSRLITVRSLDHTQQGPPNIPHICLTLKLYKYIMILLLGNSKHPSQNQFQWYGDPVYGKRGICGRGIEPDQVSNLVTWCKSKPPLQIL